jgi:hypothetical protein
VDTSLCVASDRQTARYGPWRLSGGYIADAGIRGTAARQSIAGGRDPIETRAAEKAAAKAIAEALTFEQAARKLHESLRPGWKNSKHADQWINALRDYVFPKIGKKKVAELAPAGFAEVLVDRI